MNLTKLYNKFLPYLQIALIVAVSTFILWLPFILRLSPFGIIIEKINFQYIYRHFDGLFYLISAKTLYDVKQIDVPGVGFILSVPLSARYFAAHLPLYPLFIRLFSHIFGYLKSMLFVNVFFTAILASFFYFFLKKLKLVLNPLLLIIVFLFLPRFLVVRSVGAPESLFILLILISVFFFEKGNYWLAGLAGGLSVMTKSPGILLLPVYLLVFIERYIKSKKIEWKGLGIFLIPLGLLAVFILYQIQMNDFWAYFHSGDNIHLVFPYSVFNAKINWVGTAWLEEIVFYFFIYALTVISLFRSKHRSMFYFVLVFFVATTFVQHRDISRYSLPLWPFACIAFEKFFTSKKFLLALIIILPAIYLYAWNFLGANVMPISDWKPFL